MKNLLCIASAAALLLILQQTHAQNTAPYWSLAGNSNASATTSKLGTTNSVPLRIYTKNAERIRIDTLGRVGIGVLTPTERLHVNSATGNNPFRVQINGNTKLFIHSGGGTAIGANSTPPANGLFVAGRTGIGTSAPSNELHVVGRARITKGLSVDQGSINLNNTDTGEDPPGTSYNGISVSVSGRGITSYGEAGGVWASGDAIGISGQGYDYESVGVSGRGEGYGVTGNGGYHTGVMGEGDTYGVYGLSLSTFSDSGSTGVYGTGYRGVQGVGRIGVYGVTKISNGDAVRGEATASTAYGVIGTSQSSIGVYGRTYNSSSYAGFFNGNVYSTGTYTSSDHALKQEIEDVSSAMDLIGKLQPKSYSFRQDGKFKPLNLPQGRHYGLIAQDVEKILPEVVKTTTFDGGKGFLQTKQNGQQIPDQQNEEPLTFKAVNYTELIPIVVKGMQEQEERIQQQDEIIEALLQQVNELKNQVSRLNGQSTTTVTGSSLGQNTPNPAKTTTRIAYAIPGNSRAQLVLTDASGKTVKTVLLNGSGRVDVNTATLSSGLYNYSLLVDGKTVATKRLTVSR